MQPNFRLGRIVVGLVSGVALSVLALYMLLRFYRLEDDLPRILTSVPVPYIVLAFALLAIGWVADALRLREISAIYESPLPLRTALAAVLAGNFSINITPFYMGAGLVHIYVLTKRGLDVSKATAAIAGGAMMAHACQGLLALASLVFTWEAVSRSVPATRLIVFGVSFYLVVIALIGIIVYRLEDPGRFLGGRFKRGFLRGLAERLSSFHDGLMTLMRAGGIRLLRVFLFSCLYLVTFYAITPVLLRGLGSVQPLGYLIAFQLIIFFAASLAPTPGSTGAIELGAFSLFALIVPLDILGIFLVWWRILTFYVNVLLGSGPFLYFLLSKRWFQSS